MLPPAYPGLISGRFIFHFHVLRLRDRGNFSLGFILTAFFIVRRMAAGFMAAATSHAAAMRPMTAMHKKHKSNDQYKQN